MKKLKRVFTLLLAMALSLSLAAPAAAADDATGTTIRLSETEGSVTVKDQTGKTKTVRTDMRLYNGYVIETGRSSAAYISLDDERAIMLDASGKIEVKKSGKKLEISVSAGTLVFSVERPLGSSESLNIRTATMVTGVRGCTGWAGRNANGSDEVGLLEGNIGVKDNFGGSRALTGGQLVRSTDGGAISDLVTMTVGDIPLGAAKLVAEKPAVQTLITQQAPNLSVSEIINSIPAKEAEAAASERNAYQSASSRLDAQNSAIAGDVQSGTGPFGAQSAGTQQPGTMTAKTDDPLADAAQARRDEARRDQGSTTGTEIAPALCYVTFIANADDATGKMSVQTAQLGARTTLSPNAFTRQGYAFDGWNTEADRSGTAYADGAMIVPTGNMTLYAQWRKISPTRFTITFVGNGGMGSMSQQVIPAGSGDELFENKFSYTGYTFAGWNTRSDGKGVSYPDREWVKPTADMTLYAQWKKDGTPENPGFTDSSLTLAIKDSVLTATFTVPSGATGSYGFRLVGAGGAPKSYDWHDPSVSLDFLTAGTYTDFEVFEAEGNTHTTVYSGKLSHTVTCVVTEEPVPVDVSTLNENNEVVVRRTDAPSGDNFKYRYYVDGTLNDVNYYLYKEKIYKTVFSGGYHGSNEVFDSCMLAGSRSVAAQDGRSYTVTVYQKRDCKIMETSAPTTVTVTFWSNWPNGGTEAKNTQKIALGYATALMTNQFRPNGYTFIGWNEEPDGSGSKTYKDGEKVTLTSDEELVLYAQWKADTAETSWTSGSTTVTFAPTTGVMTVSGTGAMADYLNPNAIPWNAYLSGILSVSIGNGVTRVGKNAFYGCASLASVSMPSSVTSIGEQAFYNCTALADMTLPNRLTSIELSAFDNCDGLTSVTIPGSLTSMGEQAFWGCDSLTDVTIESGVTSIGKNAFGDCVKLASVTIPVSVTSIETQAFNDCVKLKDVYYGGTQADWDNITINTTGNEALSSATIHYAGPYTWYSGGTTVTYAPDDKTLTVSPVSGGSGAMADYSSVDDVPWKSRRSDIMCVIVEEGVTVIGQLAFSDCDNAKRADIPLSVTSVKNGAFSSCLALTDVYYAGTQDDWSKITIDSANNDALTGATLHLKLSWTSGATTVTYDSGSKTLTVSPVSGGDGKMADYSSTSSIPWRTYHEEATDIAIESGVTYIGREAFDSFSKITSATLPTSVTTIGEYAFYGCTKLESITIPASVTSIKSYAFYWCSSLTDVAYGGTKAQWALVEILEKTSSNQKLVDATVHCSNGIYGAVTLTIPQTSAYMVALDGTYDSKEENGSLLVSVKAGAKVTFGVTPTAAGGPYTLGPDAVKLSGTALVPAKTVKQDGNDNYTDWYEVTFTTSTEVTVSGTSAADLYTVLADRNGSSLTDASGNLAVVSPYDSGAFPTDSSSGTVNVTALYVKPGASGKTTWSVSVRTASTSISMNGTMTAWLTFGTAGAAAPMTVRIAPNCGVSFDGYAAFNKADIVNYGYFYANDRVDLLGCTFTNEGKLEANGSLKTTKTVSLYADSSTSIINNATDSNQSGSSSLSKGVELHGETSDLDDGAVAWFDGSFTNNGMFLNNGRLIGSVTGTLAVSGSKGKVFTTASTLGTVVSGNVALTASATLTDTLTIPESAELLLLDGVTLSVGDAAASGAVDCAGSIRVFVGASVTVSDGSTFSLAGGRENGGRINAYGGELCLMGTFTTEDRAEFHNAGKTMIYFSGKFENNGLFYHYGTELSHVTATGTDETGVVTNLEAVLDNSHNGSFTFGGDGKLWCAAV